MANNIITLVAGDWSADGHGKTESRTYTCNVTAAQFREFMRNAVSAQDAKRLDRIASNYGDKATTEDQYAILARIGFAEEMEASEYITLDEFFELRWFLVKMSFPELQYEQIYGSEITIGGYGFFS